MFYGGLKQNKNRTKEETPRRPGQPSRNLYLTSMAIFNLRPGNEEQLVGRQFFLITYRSKFSSPSIRLNQIKTFDFNISKLICRVMSRRSRPLCRHPTLLPTCDPEERCVTTQVTVAYETRLQNNQKPNEINRHSPNCISKHCTQEFWSITCPKVSELSLVQRENI